MPVSIVDYGIGNLGSVRNMFIRIGQPAEIVSQARELESATKILLPGVGAFDRGITELRRRGFFSLIQDLGRGGIPILGICLGMQMLMEGSEEGQEEGLGLISGFSERFEPARVDGGRIPHMGWNVVRSVADDALLDGLTEKNRFYFAHSYYVVPALTRSAIGVTEYGGDFASMIREGNVAGAQFHPEKSHHFGATLLKNFATS